MREGHDKLAVRLASILMHLNDGKRFSIDELATEFNVDARTIQRDLNERLSFMPIKKEDGKYFLEPFALGKLSFKDIENFAALSGIRDLYPRLDAHFISDLLSSKINNILIIRADGYEKIDYDDFERISAAILRNVIIYFDYKDKRREAHPYKLVNYRGIWYVLASESGKLKHFSFTKISNLMVSEQPFKPDEDIKHSIQHDKNIWFGDFKDIVIYLSKDAKEYFFRKPVFMDFKIIDEDSQGYTLSIRSSYEDEILNIVKQWIPYMRIIEPLELKERLKHVLQDYLGNYDT